MIIYKLNCLFFKSKLTMSSTRVELSLKIFIINEY